MGRSARSGLGVILFALAGVAWPHIPVVGVTGNNSPSAAFQIPRSQISWAIYANLNAACEVDYYSFELKAPGKTKITILTPFLPEYEDFYPAFAVIGPGLPLPKGKMPFELPPGYGAVVQAGAPVKPRPVFYEPFSRKQYYQGFPEFNQELTRPGTYYIAVWDPAGGYGAYILGYGEKEGFTLKDWVNTFKVLSVIKSDKWVGKRGYPTPAFKSCP